jgi:hypothetical protein
VRKNQNSVAAVGVVENGNTATLVTIRSDGEVLDRRQVELTRGLPTHPYHHEGAWAMGRYLNSPWARRVTLEEALALITLVHQAADCGAREHLAKLADAVGAQIRIIALRKCPELPPTVEQIISDQRAQSVADSVMYRQAMANVAEHLGWEVSWYDRATVYKAAARALGVGVADDALKAMGRTVGVPWQAKHKLAAAAAIAAGYRGELA